MEVMINPHRVENLLPNRNQNHSQNLNLQKTKNPKRSKRTRPNPNLRKEKKKESLTRSSSNSTNRSEGKVSLGSPKRLRNLSHKESPRKSPIRWRKSMWRMKRIWDRSRKKTAFMTIWWICNQDITSKTEKI